MNEKWLDLRFLTGLLFTFYGLVLAVYGLVVNPQTNGAPGWNIDLWWGLATLAFGLAFLLASRREQRLDE